MKKDLNTLIESFFARKENVLSTSVLEELIKKQFNILSEKKGKVQSKPRSVSAAYSYIPEISVSEIGWSTIETPDGETQVPSAQRQQLQQYLDNISGENLKEKIASVNRFYTRSIEDLISEGVIPSDSRSSKIQSVISYLVFLKTLTTIITNFNAASAGFSFESFLGVLLGGKQVPTGGGTIADMIAGDGTYMSLKLYAEDSVEVGGSFTDLVNDLVDPAKARIVYIVAMKNLTGEGLNREGKVTVYSFHFDMKNVMSYLSIASTHSKKCIQLPEAFIASGGKTDFSKLKKTIKPKNEIENHFAKLLDKTFKSSPEFLNKIKAACQEAEGKAETFYKSVGKQELGLNTPAVRPLEALIRQCAPAYSAWVTSDPKGKNQIEKKIKELLMGVYEATMQFAKGTDPKQQKEVEDLQKLLSKGGDYASPEKSLAYYQSLKSDKQRANALKNCYGYLNIEQFSISKSQMFKFDAVENLGEIIVGRANIESMINELAAVINQEVFEIFESLSQLTTNINQYFATGLKDDNVADAAQNAAVNIDKKTEEIQTQTKSR